MELKILLADNDASYLSLLGRALLEKDYLLYPSESKEIALHQITEHDIDAAIIDVNLPGGVEEVLEACLNKSKPIVTMGALPLKETEHLVEIMYYGIPYVKKFSNEGAIKLDTIIARMNALLRTLLIFSNNKEYQLGVLAALNSTGYKVFVADQAEELLDTFLLSEAKAILVYFPKHEDLQEIAKIRGMDSRVPIAIVINSQQGDLGGQINDKATKVITQDKLADYLEEL
jgi:DNA-binding response OmpR family regulator